MTTEELQCLNINNKRSADDPEGSPVCKKARFAASAPTGRWSHHKNNVLLDDVFDYGLGILESETDEDDKDLRACGLDAPVVDEISYSCKAVEVEDRQLWDNFMATKPALEDNVPTYFSILSDEIILTIFHFLPKYQLNTCALVCKQWHRLVQDESLWARMDISCRNLPPGALGQILSRQVLILKLAQSKIEYPALLQGCRAYPKNFRCRLMYLDLSMAHLDCAGLVDVFSRCHKLKKVSLEHVLIDDEVLLALSSNKDLEVLNLAMAMGVQVDGMRHVLSNCTKLRELNIAWTCLKQNCIKYVCANLANTLDRLNISGCRKLLQDDNLKDLVRSCPNLRELDLSDCTALTDDAVPHLLNLQGLNFLAASRCYLITSRALLLLHQLPSLTYLDVHGGYITPAEVMQIQLALGNRVHINKFKFSSVARPTVGCRRSSIWNLRVRE